MAGLTPPSPDICTTSQAAVALRKKKCCNAAVKTFGGVTMAYAKLLRRQAASCASIAKQTHDEDSRQRCLQLEQTYLQLAQNEEQIAARLGATPDENAKPLA
jgi:hypothetical protein